MLISSVLVISLFTFINAETIDLQLENKDNEMKCKSKNKYVVEENQDIIVKVTSSLYVNGVRCLPYNVTSINGTDISAIFQYHFNSNNTQGVYIKKIGVATENVKGEWKCTFLTQQDTGKIEPILTVGNHNYTAPVCSVHLDLQPNLSKHKNDGSNKWIYIGVSIGVLVAIVLAMQTYAVFYFKRQAQTAAMHCRFQRLSMRTENDSVSDQARYKTKLTPVAVPRPESVESEKIYETIDVFKARAEAQRDIDISSRPPVPLPVEESYEDVDAILMRSGQSIPPPMAPSIETLPRKPKIPKPGLAMLKPSIEPNLPSQSSPYPIPKRRLSPTTNPPVPSKPEIAPKAPTSKRLNKSNATKALTKEVPSKPEIAPKAPTLKHLSKINATNIPIKEESSPLTSELDTILKKRFASSTSQTSSESSSTISPPPSQPKPPPAAKQTNRLFSISKKAPAVDKPPITPQVDIAPVKLQMSKAPLKHHASNAPPTPNVTNGPMTRCVNNAPISPRANIAPQSPCKLKPLPPLPPLPVQKPSVPTPPEDGYIEEVYYDSGEWDPEYLTHEHIYNI